MNAQKNTDQFSENKLAHFKKILASLTLLKSNCCVSMLWNGTHYVTAEKRGYICYHTERSTAEIFYKRASQKLTH